MSTPDRKAQALPQALSRTLDDHGELGTLLARLHETRRRWDAVQDALPPELVGSVRPGGADATSWVLLADHAPAAAKLRHCVPRIVEALAQSGCAGVEVKVKVRPRV